MNETEELSQDEAVSAYQTNWLLNQYKIKLLFIDYFKQCNQELDG